MSKMSKAVAVLGVVAGLGVAALPLSTYAATDTDNTTAKVTVNDAIDIEIAADEVVMNSGTGVVADGAVGTGTTTFTIKSNKSYGVTVSNASETALKPAEGGTAAGIPAGNPAQGTSAWGFKATKNGDGNSTSSTVVSPAEGNSYLYLAAANTPVSIASGGQTSSTGDSYNLAFGVSVDATIAPATYSNTVTLTATTN